MCKWFLGTWLGSPGVWIANLRTPGEDEGLRGARVGGTLVKVTPWRTVLLQDRAGLADGAQRRYHLPVRDCTPKRIEALLRDLIILKRKRRTQPTHVPDSNQQLTNLFFFKLPEVAMVTCMRSSQASCSKWGCLEQAFHPPCGAPACARCGGRARCRGRFPGP